MHTYIDELTSISAEYNINIIMEGHFQVSMAHKISQQDFHKFSSCGIYL